MWRTSPSDPPAQEASPKPPGHPFVREAGMNRFRFHTLVLAALAIWPAVGSAQHAPVVDQAGSLDQSVSVQQIGTATAVDVAQQAPLARAELGLAGERLAASRSEEHTSELQSLMRISYAVFCLKKKTRTRTTEHERTIK